MATKTVSSRIDEKKLAVVEALTQAQYGMSFGKYCGSVLVDAVCDTGKLPKLETPKRQKRIEALERMKELSSKFANPKIGLMSDAEIKDLIASRYE